jgi:hypothetical protein
MIYILVALISAASVLFTNYFVEKYRRNKEKRNLIREKLEEIYMLVNKIQAMIGEIQTRQLKSFISGEIADFRDTNLYDLHRLRMLIVFYAPSLTSIVNQYADEALSLVMDYSDYVLNLKEMTEAEKAKKRTNIVKRIGNIAKTYYNLVEEIEKIAPQYI